MSRPLSPYLAPGFYDRALDAGRHRQITGGWWEETGRLQLALLREAGLTPGDGLLDIGCGALRLGCKAVPFLDPGRYWGTDASGALMRRGREVELDDAARARLPLGQLVEDAVFAFPGVPGDLRFAIAWGVFTHLPLTALERCLASLARFGGLRAVLFTVFHPGPGGAGRPVTHADRPPYALGPAAVETAVRAAGFRAAPDDRRLPRGQVLYVASPVGKA